MNFQQLRIVRETVRRQFNLTEVANALYTSQSGVSKHIKDLEDELGVELFIRKGKRLLGLTEPGREMISVVEQMLIDASSLRRLAQQFSQSDQGRLSVVATHTQARYALPGVIARFRGRYPRVQLALHQSSYAEIVAMLRAGDADIGIATEGLDTVPDLATFRFYDWQHGLVVPLDHPLAKQESPLTLEQLAEHPIITYHEGFTGRARVDDAFGKAGITPDIRMTALDSDVIKTYVEMGLGVGIIASMAHDASKDTGLALISCKHMFAPNTTYLALRKGHYLRDYALQFMIDCVPGLTEAVITEKAALVR
jgi:LysR family cys regulon transcriptional activator